MSALKHPRRSPRQAAAIPAASLPATLGPDAEVAAALREAQMRYVDDSRPGIRRKKLGAHWAYYDVQGKRIKDQEEIRRINKLAVPPAYTDVWICPDPAGHLQATGRDARGRKQYRYHPRWRELRDAGKYGRLLQFGEVLPRIRARIARDMEQPGMPREKLLATLLHLLDVTLIRIGNEEYARQNRSFGLTTLRNRHVEVHGGRVCFRFRGKSGVEHDVTISDPRTARIIRRCLEIPGQDLFQYIDEDGVRHGIGSADVNDYLRAIAGADFSAKDYRTWAGSALALARLSEITHASVREAKSNVVATLREVAQLLGNTPAVCRKAYVHPQVLEHYMQGRLGQGNTQRIRLTGKLRREEARLLAFLRAAHAPQAALTDLLEQSVGQARGPARPGARRTPQAESAVHQRKRTNAGAAPGNRSLRSSTATRRRHARDSQAGISR